MYLILCHHYCLEGHSLWVSHKQDWGQGFILLLPQVAVLPGSDAGSDGVKFCHPKSLGLVLHVVPDVWGMLLKVDDGLFRGAILAICKGARPYLCIDEWNHPTPVCKQLSLTQAVQGKFKPTSLALVEYENMKPDVFSQYSVFHL